MSPKQPASEQNCPAKTSRDKCADPAFCLKIGSSLPHNSVHCKRNQCKSPWRICWACAEQKDIRAPDSYAVDQRSGLCDFHRDGSDKRRPEEAKKIFQRALKVDSPVPPPTPPIVRTAPKGEPSTVGFTLRTPPIPLRVEGGGKKQDRAFIGGDVDLLERPRKFPGNTLVGKAPEPDPRVAAIIRLRDSYKKKPAVEIPIEQIIRDEQQIRQYFDPELLGELATSIAAIGQNESGLVIPFTSNKPGEEQIRFKLVDGERRFRACTMAGVKTYLAVVCEENDPLALLAVSMIRNFQRAAATSIEKALAYKRLREQGCSAEMIAGLEGCYVHKIYYYLRFNNLDPRVVAMLDPSLRKEKKQLSSAVAAKLAARFPDEKQHELQFTLAKKVVDEQLSNAAADHMIQKWIRDGGIEVRTRDRTPSDIFETMRGRFDRAAHALELYCDARTEGYTKVLATRSREERKRIEAVLQSIEGMAKQLRESIPKD